jgi:hypothetical protein
MDYFIRLLVVNLLMLFEKRIIQEQQSVKQRFISERAREKKPESPPEDKEDQGSPLGEYGYRVRGPEPTRFGDWERRGRVSDF